MRSAICAVPLIVLTALVGAGCAGGGGGTVLQAEPTAYRGVPGFDTRTYPGDAVMREWRAESPYRWVGYYLPAPCYTGRTWLGKRAALRSMGWGVAVIFVGEQDWAAAAGPTAGGLSDSSTAGPRCTRANVTAARGAADALQADSAAAAEGFPAGTVVFLDVERVEVVSSGLEAYVRAWTRGLIDGGRYAPGLYAHARNAGALHAIVVSEAAARNAARPPLWVATGEGFRIEKAPAESGFAAEVWQGVFDKRETWGGAALTIDVNVASSASPSGR